MYLIHICMYVLSYMYLCIYFDFDIEKKESESESESVNILEHYSLHSLFSCRSKIIKLIFLWE